MDNAKEKYADIFDRPRHISKKHPRMPLASRASIFSPFAALTGYDDLVEESARQTDEMPELTDDEKANINDRLTFLLNRQERKPVRLKIFRYDERKAGGKFIFISGTLREFDESSRQVVLDDGRRIDIELVFGVN